MNIDALKKFDLIYVGSPYSKYPGGIELAFIDVCEMIGDLIRSGLSVYSPIAHTHPIAIHAGIDPLDHSMWMHFDGAMMAKSDAMIIAMMDGWDASSGIQLEIDAFNRARKPVFLVSQFDLSCDVWLP